MRILLDTNIINRLAEPGHAMHRNAYDATFALRGQGHTLCLVPQNLYEFWVVSTRPLTANGFGKTVVETVNEVNKLRSVFVLLPDSPLLFQTWESVVTANAVMGKNAHDARLVAAMMTHGITHLLTFNDQDFRRFSGITVMTPAGVLRPVAPPTVLPPPTIP